MTRHWYVATLIGCLLIFSSIATANVIANPSVTFVSGVYTYDYSVQNLGAVPLLGFLISVPAEVSNIQSPVGWDVSTVSLFDTTVVQWVSLDVPFDVPASGTLSGFSIDSLSPPGTVNFTTLDENFTEFNGQTQGPVAPSVPEPNTVFLLCPVVVTFLIMASKRARLRLDR